MHILKRPRPLHPGKPQFDRDRTSHLEIDPSDAANASGARKVVVILGRGRRRFDQRTFVDRELRKAAASDREFVAARLGGPEIAAPAVAHRRSRGNRLAHEAEKTLFDTAAKWRGKIGAGKIFGRQSLDGACKVGAESPALRELGIGLVVDTVRIDELHVFAEQLGEALANRNLPRGMHARAAVALHAKVFDAGSDDRQRLDR